MIISFRSDSLVSDTQSQVTGMEPGSLTHLPEFRDLLLSKLYRRGLFQVMDDKDKAEQQRGETKLVLSC